MPDPNRCSSPQVADLAPFVADLVSRDRAAGILGRVDDVLRAKPHQLAEGIEAAVFLADPQPLHLIAGGHAGVTDRTGGLTNASICGLLVELSVDVH